MLADCRRGISALTRHSGRIASYNIGFASLVVCDDARLGGNTCRLAGPHIPGCSVNPDVLIPGQKWIVGRKKIDNDLNFNQTSFEGSIYSILLCN